MTDTSPDLLSIREAATYAGVSVRTIHRHLASGRLRALRNPLSRRVYIRESDLRASRERAVQRLTGALPERPAKGV